jgi:hypothetical protein
MTNINVNVMFLRVLSINRQYYMPETMWTMKENTKDNRLIK